MSYRPCDSFCLNLGWLYTHLVAANSGILVQASPPSDLRREAREAVNGVERNLMHTNANNTTETAHLLPSSVSEKLNGSIQTFMAMYGCLILHEQHSHKA